MKAKSISGASAKQIELALSQSMTDGYKPTLAFVFLSAVEEIDAITAMLELAKRAKKVLIVLPLLFPLPT
ncbi:MAG: hypothetical protein EOO14_00810 [Chitinophagaceae bacterium]|nr:MAG: hypothetical protein EOO14_00810 [Chitinophagaceae bacterium]